MLEKILNMDETSPFWKQVPEKTFIRKEAEPMPGLKAFKDWTTVLLGAMMQLRIETLCDWHSENPAYQ